MLRIIATFIIIYLVFRVFTLYILPYLVRWYLNRVKKKFYEQNPHLRQEETPKGRKGVKITYSQSSAQQKSLDDIGEYIDYEDLDNNQKQKDKN